MPVPNERIMRMWALAQTLSCLKQAGHPKLDSVIDLITEEIENEAELWARERQGA